MDLKKMMAEDKADDMKDEKEEKMEANGGDLDDFLEEIMKAGDMPDMGKHAMKKKMMMKEGGMKGEGKSAEHLLMKIAHIIKEYCEDGECGEDGKPEKMSDDDEEDHPRFR